MRVYITEAWPRCAWSVPRVNRTLLSVLALIAFFGVNTHARSSLSGQVAGTVVDQTGASVGGAWVVLFGVAGLFAAGGTGEGFSLTTAEIDTVAPGMTAPLASVMVPSNVPFTACACTICPAHAKATTKQIILMTPPSKTLQIRSCMVPTISDEVYINPSFQDVRLCRQRVSGVAMRMFNRDDKVQSRTLV